VRPNGNRCSRAAKLPPFVGIRGDLERMTDSDESLQLSERFIARAAGLPIAAIELPALGERRAREAGATTALDAVRFVYTGLSESAVTAKNLKLSRVAAQNFVGVVETASGIELKHLSSPSGLHLSASTIRLTKVLPVDALWLKPKAKKALGRAGAKNCFEAIKLIQGGFEGVNKIGDSTKRESLVYAREFLVALETTGEVPTRRPVAPGNAFGQEWEGNVVRALPVLLDAVLKKKWKSDYERNADLVAKRLGLKGKSDYTLDDLGTYYDISRERVRQVAADSVEALGVVLAGAPDVKALVVDIRLVDQFCTLRGRLDQSLILRGPELRKEVEAQFGEAGAFGYYELLLGLLGFERLPRAIDGFAGKMPEGWFNTRAISSEKLENLFRSLSLVYTSSQPVEVFRLMVEAKRRVSRTISEDNLRVAISFCSDLNCDGDSVSVRFAKLGSAAEKAFQVLQTSGEPMHFSDIAREINRRNAGESGSPVTPRYISSQLSTDARFKKIGNSGLWGLADWASVVDITITAAIERVLSVGSVPLSFREIQTGVAEIRPDASRNSLSAYLHGGCDKFVRVARDAYALSIWKPKSIYKPKKSVSFSGENFAAVILDLFRKQNPIPLAELVRKLVSVSGLRAISVRNRIDGAEFLRKVATPGVAQRMIYCDDLDFDPAEVGRSRANLRERVQAEIRSILHDRPNSPISKGDLYREVEKAIKCNKQTYYAYLSEINELRSYKDGKRHLVVFDNVETVVTIEIDLSAYSVDAVLCETLSRSLGKLTIEEVDLALYELGLLFENSLKDYMHLAKGRGVLNATMKDLKSLFNMVNCAVREKVIKRGHHLHVLRDERNERAHGKKLDQNGRQELFNRAHYIAELFVRYIALFTNKRQELEAQPVPPPTP
jgi:hypothetical protein